MMPKRRLSSEEDDALRLGWSAALQAIEVSHSAPLSARHALHAAVLLDQLSDLAFVRRTALLEPPLATCGDFLSFRTALRDCEPVLGLLMDLTACRMDGPSLLVTAAQVAPDGFANLSVGDLMVSLYNGGTVPRLMLMQSDGKIRPMQDVLQQATKWWQTTLAHQLL
jgi:hypothetical protein